MDDKNLINRPSILIGLTILILIGISYIPEGITIFGFEIKRIDILEDLEESESFDKIREIDSLQSRLIKKDQILFTAASINLSSNIFKEFNSFINVEYEKLVSNNRTKGLQLKNHPLEGNVEQLKYFFEALDSARKKQVRIAHYGDSSLEGDLISSYLRNEFQQKFGGKGVGFLPITSEDVSFRETAKITFSEGWESISISRNNLENIPVGINGKAFINSRESFVKIETIPKFRTTKDFNIARIFYNRAASGSSLKYSLNGLKEQSIILNAGEKINEISIEKDHSNSLELSFPTDRGAIFYGISLEDKTGVCIDNFPLRGSSGVDLKKISPKYLQEFNSLLGYKLVILEFGLNILSGRKTNFAKYEEDMVEIVTDLKASFPQTSFLIVGVRDKAIKRKKNFITDPSIIRLMETQKRIAMKTNIAFWNLFEAMGGENSMTNWVNANPPLAYTDYTHFTSLGTKEEAEMLFKTLMQTKSDF